MAESERVRSSTRKSKKVTRFNYENNVEDTSKRQKPDSDVPVGPKPKGSTKPRKKTKVTVTDVDEEIAVPDPEKPGKNKQTTEQSFEAIFESRMQNIDQQVAKLSSLVQQKVLLPTAPQVTSAQSSTIELTKILEHSDAQIALVTNQSSAQFAALSSQSSAQLAAICNHSTAQLAAISNHSTAQLETITKLTNESNQQVSKLVNAIIDLNKASEISISTAHSELKQVQENRVNDLKEIFKSMNDQHGANQKFCLDMAAMNQAVQLKQIECSAPMSSSSSSSSSNKT